MRTTVAALTVAGALVLAGCASSSRQAAGSSPEAASSSVDSSPSSSPPAPSIASSPPNSAAPPPASAASAASNKAAAKAEAQRLLALAAMPPGAIPVSSGPAALDGLALGAPQTSSLLDFTRYWRVTLPFADAVAWVKAHPPAGLISAGSSSGGGPGVQSAGFSYSDADSAAWWQAQFEIGIASDGPTASVIRADGVALWLDPQPMPAPTTTGTRVRISVAGGCPATDRGDVGVTNTGSDLDAALLPRARPTAALLCGYDQNLGPAGSTTGALTEHRTLGSADAVELAAAALKSPLSHLDDVETNCPMDDGAVTVLAFAYPGRADVDLWWATTGCQTVTNGHILTAPYGGFQDEAARLAVPGAGSPPPDVASASSAAPIRPPMANGSPPAP